MASPNDRWELLGFHFSSLDLPMPTDGQKFTIAYFSAIDLGVPDAANNHTLEICAHLSRRGHTIYLFSPQSATTNKQPETFQIIMTPALGKENSLLRTFSFYLLLPFFAWRYFLHLRPDVLYTRFSFLEFLAVLPLRLLFTFVHVAEINGIRSIESQGIQIKSVIIYLLERLSLALCDAVIAITTELANWVTKSSPVLKDNIVVIGNGVNVDIFVPREYYESCRSLGLNPDVIYINFTGSLRPWHGVEVILNAMPIILSKINESVQLLVVGDGPEKGRLLNIATDLSLESLITWVGKVPRENVPDYINASKICLAPFSVTRNDQVGSSALKVFEYMSCAKPIVTTRIGATYDNFITEGGFGLLVPPDDAAALADAVLELLNDPEKAMKMGKLGRQIVLECYSWEKIAEKTETFLYQQLPSRNR